MKLSAGDEGRDEMDSDLVLDINVSMTMPEFRAAQELYVDVVAVATRRRKIHALRSREPYIVKSTKHHHHSFI